MTKPTDDLEAVRIVVGALEGFKEDEQQRIFRWAAEKLGMKTSTSTSSSNADTSTGHTQSTTTASHPAGGSSGAQDIRAFVNMKSPGSDVQFAATVAYYYQFEAPTVERKTFINKDDLQDATRKVGRDRLTNPVWTLQNAQKLGLLDKKADEPGAFSINTVGENLVAMALPKSRDADGTRKKNARKKPARKKARAKKA